jgi:MYXO-CTERM domain-containing protein
MICDGDCDDDLVEVHPGAEELCADALDSDCDGALDPPDMDLDDDGFDTDSCGGEDCDDADAAIHPDATEICEDGVDNNCDGTEEDCMMLGGSVPLVAGGGCSACDLTDSGGRPTGGVLWFGLFLVGGLARRRRH